ncbi:MAG: hypothetical protein ACLP0J_08220 [Solirubrobacteraceae bacterium]
MASGALAIVVLPVFAGVACGLIALAAVAYGIWARRLMESERRNRRWAYIQGKRIQQRELRSLAAVDVAILAICGDRQVRFSGRQNPELTQALAHLEGRVRQTALAALPQDAGAAQRQPAVPAPPDLAAVRRRLQKRQSEIEALEAEIQALAVPGDAELEQDASERRQAELDLTEATWRAERAARERRRLGQKPTRAAGEEIGLQLQVGPEGVRQISSAGPRERFPRKRASGFWSLASASRPARRRIPSVDSERLVERREMTKASVGLVQADARVHGEAIALRR